MSISLDEAYQQLTNPSLIQSDPTLEFARIKQIAAQLDANLPAGKIPVFYSGFLPSEYPGADAPDHTGVVAAALGRSANFAGIADTDVGKFLGSDLVNNKFETFFEDQDIRKQMTERAADAPWRTASERFAQGVDGPVLSIAPIADTDSVWLTTELPTLINNPDVTLINGIDRASALAQLDAGTISVDGINTTLSNVIPWQTVLDNINFGDFDFADAANSLTKFAGRVVGPEEIAGAAIALGLAALVGQEAFDAELEYWQAELGIGVLLTLGLVATGAIFPSAATAIATLLVPFAIAGILEIVGRITDLWDQADISLFDTILSLFGSLENIFEDPLAIDLDGDGVNTTSVGESGVTFDLDNNGTEEGTGWFEAEDGILFHDWKGGTDENGNPVGDGEAQDRSELFENFEQLSRHDLNGDGILDARDVAPQTTTDTNGDGIIDASDVVLPDEDTNGDGVIDVNDISPYAQDTNGDGIISEDEITQPTITGDFDGDGTTETINVSWDRAAGFPLAA